MFELDNLLICEGFYNAGRRNGTLEETPVRLWSASIALYYLDQIGGPQENPSFGFTAEFGKRYSGRMKDPNVGMRGAWRVRVGESIDEQISAACLGYITHDSVVEAV